MVSLTGLKLTDYDYFLPQELIAQRPAKKRGASRLLVLDRKRSCVTHHKFADIVDFFSKGDLLVVNDTKVIPARLIGRRQSGGRVEVFLLKPAGSGSSFPKECQRYQALIKPLGRLKLGEEIFFEEGFSCKLQDAKNKIVEFHQGNAEEAMQKVGLIPLPPYIRRQPDRSDKYRYQTVFAKNKGAVAAPTAGLHFTTSLFGALRQKGVRIVSLTLHVNYGTFSPVHAQDIRDHRMHEEYFTIPALTGTAIRETKKNKGRIWAVGTTVCKALEDSAGQMLKDGPVGVMSKWSSLFIYPPFDFKIVDGLITNFHLPRTSLLILVSAFAGRDPILSAYREAVQKKYHFYSYGDAMLIQ